MFHRVDYFYKKQFYLNKDYTPFSLKRDKTIEEVCQKNNVKFNSYADCLINEPGQVLKDNGSHYTVFTPFLERQK